METVPIRPLDQSTSETKTVRSKPPQSTIETFEPVESETSERRAQC